ncbi:synaptotagmin-2-like isoform X2 [Dendronephthya gigantea]|nr:synaptotagmin-2-like isoform X2 [Dendronephthya gigantea]
MLIEGITVGILAALVLLLVCIIIIKRRRRKKNHQAVKNYSSADTDSSPTEFLEDRRNLDTCPLISTEYEPVQPEKTVTWADPVAEPEIKPRSYSCPVARRNAFSDINPNVDENKRKCAETPSTRNKKRSRRYRIRSKTDLCFQACQVQFTVFYNYYHSKLTVQLVCAVNIPSTFGLTYGSYIVVELQPSLKKHATNVQFHTNNPAFNETVEFPGISSEEFLNMSLRLGLYAVDRRNRSTLIGEVIVPMAELDLNPNKPSTIWRPITDNDQQSRLSTSLVSLKDIVDRGELTISLKYQILSSKITVVIMKAVNLPNISKIFAIDPYVIVKLLLHLKTIQTKKTSIKRRTTSPCWNEPLVFELDSKIPIVDYSMSFKVKSHNSLSEDFTVGEIEIGKHAEDSGRQHWDDMIKRKNHDRAMSHKIK